MQFAFIIMINIANTTYGKANYAPGMVRRKSVATLVLPYHVAMKNIKNIFRLNISQVIWFKRVLRMKYESTKFRKR